MHASLPGKFQQSVPVLQSVIEPIIIGPITDCTPYTLQLSRKPSVYIYIHVIGPG